MLAQNMNEAMRDVLLERRRQDAKWGEQNHDPFLYGAILVEEIGEFMQAALQTRVGGEKGGVENIRREAVQMAAVALAIVECLDRNRWRFAVPPPVDFSDMNGRTTDAAVPR